MHDQDVVTLRSNTRVTTSSGASGEPPQSTPGISTASLTAGQVSADVHDNSEGTDTRAKGDNLNSPPVRINAPKTAGQGNNEKDMTLPLQQQDSLNKDVFLDTPDSGQPQSPNSCGALAESLTADQIQAIEEAGGEMSGRGRKKSGEGELKLLEQQVKNLKREVQQKEQAKTDLSAHHQELISVLIKSADKMEQELRNQLNEKEKEKNCYERKTADKEKELDKTKVALQEAENKRLRDLAEAKQLYDKGKVKLKEVNKAREADNQHYKDIINDKELEIKVLKRKNARLSKVICELKRLMEGNTCRPDKNFSGQQHYEEDHHRRASFDDSDDADDTPDVSLARMRLSVLPNATSTPELSRPTEVNSPVKDSNVDAPTDSTSNVDAPTDSTSNVDAPTVNPASATEDQQASVSEKSSSVEST
ncbi:hypothetical protein V1264_017299 [Littorina saxatilis]|uniref:Uncharacterized protein n=1 Tax=Littorina saxatilis TaxID=31220 RepID=A0AAN9GF24_9CAEN